MPFKTEFTKGKPETSIKPSMTSGRGPKIKNATANEMTVDKM